MAKELNISTREMLGMLTQAGKRPQNSMMISVSGLLLADKPWTTPEGVIRHKYLIFVESLACPIEFGSTMELVIGKRVENLRLQLDGFSARHIVAPAVVPHQGVK